jgi:tetratricopeptide (TPR) repeat protein
MPTRFPARPAALLAAVLLAPAAAADVILLKDGRIIEREKMEKTDAGVKVFFENGEVLVAKDLIQDAVLASAPPAIPDTPEAKEKAAKGLVPFEGKWLKPADRDAAIQKKIAEKRAAIEEVRKHSQWRDRYKEETKHFKFEYTVAPHVFAYYRDLMEAYYDEFAKTWKIKQPKDFGKLLVCFYTDHEAFGQTGGTGVGSGVQGYFRFVPPLELNFYYSRLDPYHTEQVMYHEANHYLQLLLKTDFNMPHFPGEAIAEYYGASRFDPVAKKLSTGHVLEGRLAEIQSDVASGDMMGLEKMLKTEMYEHYTWGWSLVHFLMNDKRYAKKFEGFVKDLVHGKNVKRTRGNWNLESVSQEDVCEHFRRALGVEKDEAFDALEREWHAYVKDELKFVTANGLEKGASSALRSGRPIKAKRLFKEAIEKGTTNPVTYYRYAELLADDGKWDEALPLYRKAIELGPLEGIFYLDLGAALIRQGGDKEEAKRLVQLARELSPEDSEIEWRSQDLLKDLEKGS